MSDTKPIFTTIDEYILQFPPDIQELLQSVRQAIQESAPEATEKKHIGFYSTPTGHEAFKEQLSAYKGAKGSVQFPIDKPMPYALIKEIVKFRAAENISKAEAKAKKKK